MNIEYQAFGPAALMKRIGSSTPSTMHISQLSRVDIITNDLPQRSVKKMRHAERLMMALSADSNLDHKPIR